MNTFDDRYLKVSNWEKPAVLMALLTHSLNMVRYYVEL